jgi:sugar lactone lactonase YvrE
MRRALRATWCAFALLAAAAALPAVASADNGSLWYIDKWGGPGTGPGQFYLEAQSPWGIDMDAAGNIFVADAFNDRIQKFSPTGAFITAFGSSGTGDQQLINPYDVAVGPSGEVYVMDSENDRVQKFTASGGVYTSVARWSIPDPVPLHHTYLGITCDAAGNVYVAHTYGHRVLKFSSAGTLIGQVGSEGNGNLQFNQPDSVAVGPDGRLYVGDWLNHRVQVFTVSGAAFTYVATIGGNGTANGNFNNVGGVDVDAAGNVYVCDKFNRRLQVFRQTAGDYTFVTKVGGVQQDNGTDRFREPIDVVASSDGAWVYVSDFDQEIHRFARDLLAPTVSDDYDQAWHNGSVTVHLQPADQGGSGLQKTQYRPSGGAWTDAVGNAFSVPATTNGQFIYEYRALDNAENASAIGSCTVKIDTTKPTVDDDADAGWHNGSYVVHLLPADSGGSGVQKTQYRFPGGSWTDAVGNAFTVSQTASGQYTYAYQALDNAGNTSATGSCTVNLDAVAPTVADDYDLVWHNGPVTVHLLPADSGGSGLQKTQYRRSGGTWTDAAGDTFVVPATANGQFAYEYQALDNAGNVSATGSRTVKIDTAAPTTVLSSSLIKGWSRTSRLAFAATAGPSGVALTEFRIDAGPWQRGTAVTLRDGFYAIGFRSTSVAGTVETATTRIVNIDTVGPTTKALASARVKKGQHVRLRCSALDVLSPNLQVSVKFYRHGKLKKVWQVPGRKTTGRFSLSYRCGLPKGTYEWQVCATDVAGNRQQSAGRNKLVVW